MAAILFIIGAFIIMYKSINSKKKLHLSIFILLIYSIYIIIDQFYLEIVHEFSFHLSDPSAYYNYIKDITSFSGLLDFFKSAEFEGETNHFYFIINWLFNISFSNTAISAPLLLMSNALIYLATYNLITYRSNKVTIFDILLLLHPYLIFTVTRNVRDVYILFGLSLFIFSYFYEPKKTRKLILIAISILLILLTRHFFIVIPLFIIIYDYRNRLAYNTKIILGSLLTITIISFISIYINDIMRFIYNGFYGALYFHGELPFNDAEHFNKIQYIRETGEIQLFAIKDITLRILKAFPLFIFTPHPLVYAKNYLIERENGIYNIYTDLDNVLIILGGIINFLIMYPIILKYFVRIRKFSFRYTIPIIVIFTLYTVFQLGITDIRIRFTYMFFILVALKEANISIKEIKDFPYYLISISIFILYSLVLFK